MRRSLEIWTPLATAIVALSLTACESPPPSADGGPKTEAGAADPGVAEAGGDAASPGAAPAPADACAVAPIEAELARFCEYDIGIPPVSIPRVPWTATSYHPVTTRVMSLTRQGLLDPEGDPSYVSVQDWLAEPPRRVPEPGEMTIAVAADVPATTVAELQRGLSAKGRKEVRFLVLVTDPTRVPSPRIPEMLTDMKAKLPADGNERVMFVAKGVKAYAGACPQLGAAFNSLASVSHDDRCATLAKSSAEAIVACGCDKGDEIMTLLFALTMGFDPPLGRAAAVPVALDPQAKYRPKVGMTWGELAVEQFTDTQLHHLWIDAVAPPAAIAPAPIAPAAPAAPATPAG